ncbi:MAG: class E sortase [Acidimicrobiales bacterium]
MTDLITRPSQTDAASTEPAVEPDIEVLDEPDEEVEASRLTGKAVGVLVALWLLLGLIAVAMVLYLLQPLFQERSQRLLLEQYRASIEKATYEAEGLAGIEVPKRAVPFGSPVGILEIGRIPLQQVVVEGVSSEQTQGGPGHVPGSAGPGQPGNAAIVARRAMFGGPFNAVSDLQVGDQVLVSTTQGQSLYKVESVREQRIVDGGATTSQEDGGGAIDVPTTSAESDPENANTDLSSAAGAADALQAPPDSIGVDEVYGPSKDDRLTLVTSASALPTNGERATIVVAKMEGKPFAPTPQNGRTDAQTGMVGDSSAWAPVILAFLALVASAAAATVLYRRSTGRVAYLLTAAPLMVFTIVFAEQLSRLLPAWT